MFNITNSSGKVLLQQEQIFEKGINAYPIDLSNFPDGLYFLNAHNLDNSMQLHQKIIKSNNR